MKKSVVISVWMIVIFLTLGISLIFAFLPFLGPIISGLAIAKISEKLFLMNKHSVFIKIILSLFSLLAIFIIQSKMFGLSGVVVILNFLCFLGTFIVSSKEAPEEQQLVVK